MDDVFDATIPSNNQALVTNAEVIDKVCEQRATALHRVNRKVNSAGGLQVKQWFPWYRRFDKRGQTEVGL